MDAGMAAGTDSDQQIGSVPAGAPVVNGALVRSATDAAGVAVALKDQVAMAAEAGAGVDDLGVARPAQPGHSWYVGSTGAEQRSLHAARCWARHKGARGPL